MRFLIIEKGKQINYLKYEIFNVNQKKGMFIIHENIFFFIKLIFK